MHEMFDQNDSIFCASIGSCFKKRRQQELFFFFIFIVDTIADTPNFSLCPSPPNSYSLLPLTITTVVCAHVLYIYVPGLTPPSSFTEVKPQTSLRAIFWHICLLQQWE